MPSLADTSWALVRLQGEALVLPPNSRRPFLFFSADGRLFGFSGVNRFSGSPKIDGETLSFGPLAATRMAGEPAVMAIENRLFESLRLATAWHIRDGKLELLPAPGRAALAIFTPIALEEIE